MKNLKGRKKLIGVKEILLHLMLKIIYILMSENV